MPRKYTYADCELVTVSYVDVLGRPSPYDEPDKYPWDHVEGGPKCAYDELVDRTCDDPGYWQVVKCEDCGAEIVPDLDSGNFLYELREGRKCDCLDGYYQCDCGKVTLITRPFQKGSMTESKRYATALDE